MENNNTNEQPGMSNQNWNYDPVTGQPINHQQNYGQMNYDPATGQPTAQYIKQQETLADNSDPKARNLCIASLISWLIGNALVLGEDFFHKIFGPFYSKYMEPTIGIFLIAGFVLVVVALVNYPKNKFAKILLILYVVEFILFVILIILAIIACAVMFQSCFEGLQGCANMG